MHGYTHSEQTGQPGNCMLAQVFGPDGASVATFDATQPPSIATARAKRLADMLNAPNHDWAIWSESSAFGIYQTPKDFTYPYSLHIPKAGSVVVTVAHDDCTLTVERNNTKADKVPAAEGASLPHPGSPEASAMMDSMLAEYQYPSNPKNAARAGYEAARRMLATPPANLPQEALTVDEHGRPAIKVPAHEYEAAERATLARLDMVDLFEVVAAYEALLATQPARAGAVELSDRDRLDWLQKCGATIDLVPPFSESNALRFRVGGYQKAVSYDLREAIDKAIAAATTAATGGKSSVLIPGYVYDRRGKEPCGECHIQPGETCDICGATAATGEKEPS